MEPFILRADVGLRIPYCGRQGSPICRYILYCRRNKSLRHSREMQSCGLEDMIFHIVYMEVPLFKSLDSRRSPDPSLPKANPMPMKKAEPKLRRVFLGRDSIFLLPLDIVSLFEMQRVCNLNFTLSSCCQS